MHRFVPPPKDAPYRIWLRLAEKFDNNDHIHVYSRGAGVDNPRGSKYFININLLLIWSFAAFSFH